MNDQNKKLQESIHQLKNCEGIESLSRDKKEYYLNQIGREEDLENIISQAEKDIQEAKTKFVEFAYPLEPGVNFFYFDLSQLEEIDNCIAWAEENIRNDVFQSIDTENNNQPLDRSAVNIHLPNLVARLKARRAFLDQGEKERVRKIENIRPLKGLGIKDISLADCYKSLNTEIVELGKEFEKFLEFDRLYRDRKNLSSRARLKELLSFFNPSFHSTSNSRPRNFFKKSVPRFPVSPSSFEWGRSSISDSSYTRFRTTTDWYREELEEFEFLKNEIFLWNWNEQEVVDAIGSNHETKDLIEQRIKLIFLFKYTTKAILEMKKKIISIIGFIPFPKEVRIGFANAFWKKLDEKPQTIFKLKESKNEKKLSVLTDILDDAKLNTLVEIKEDYRDEIEGNTLQLSKKIAELLQKAKVEKITQLLNDEFAQLQVSPEWQELKENKKQEYQDLFSRTRQQTNDEDKNKFSQIIVEKLKKDLFKIKTAKTVGLLFQNLQNTLVGNDIEAIQEAAEELRLFYENGNSIEKVIFKFAERRVYHRWEVRVNQRIEELTKDQQVAYDNLLQEIENAQTIEQINSYDEVIENFDYEKLPPYDYGRNERVLKIAQNASIKKVLAKQKKEVEQETFDIDQEPQEQLKTQESQNQEQEIQELLQKEIQEWKANWKQYLATKPLPELPKKQSKIKKLGNKLKTEFKQVVKPKESPKPIKSSIFNTLLITGLMFGRK